MKRFLFRPLILLVVLSAGEGRAQEQAVERKSFAVVLREQAASIADEIMDSLRLASESAGRVSISVKGVSLADIVENAMLEALQRRGFEGKVLGSEMPAVTPCLRLFVLQQTGEPAIPAAGAEGYTIKTIVEARFEEDQESRHLGTFSRVTTDPMRESNGSGARAIIDSDSFLENILEPLVVVTGAFLIVFLFFTVRS